MNRNLLSLSLPVFFGQQCLPSEMRVVLPVPYGLWAAGRYSSVENERTVCDKTLGVPRKRERLHLAIFALILLHVFSVNSSSGGELSCESYSICYVNLKISLLTSPSNWIDRGAGNSGIVSPNPSWKYCGSRIRKPLATP